LYNEFNGIIYSKSIIYYKIIFINDSKKNLLVSNLSSDINVWLCY
jgi:hypothetical protein